VFKGAEVLLLHSTETSGMGSKWDLNG